jgi:hypothetical protein
VVVNHCSFLKGFILREDWHSKGLHDPDSDNQITKAAQT